jgi:hypothetical protein
VKLPNGDRAVVEIAKVRDYCLSATHFRGRHKARVFASALGLTADDAEELRQLLLVNAVAVDARVGSSDEYGDRYLLDFDVARGNWSARVRSAWIIRRDEDFPRLTSCYVLD